MDVDWILLIEDDEPIRESLLLLLELQGYTARAAKNGAEALSLLEGAVRLPGLILLDLVMPVMDGFEFREFQKADKRLRDIPVVVLTASPISERVLALGAEARLRKPFEMSDLLAEVRRFMPAP